MAEHPHHSGAPQVVAGAAQAQPHSHSRKPYLIIFGLLFALTVLEVIVALPQLAIGQLAKGSALVVLALSKAAMVALWFMHLKSEVRALRWSVLLPFSFPALYAFVLIADAAWRLLG
jgi:cytochrome c oxidase subunit IV